MTSNGRVPLKDADAAGVAKDERVRTVVWTANAPIPVGPYSQAIASGAFVFCAAQAGLDPSTGALVRGGIGPETDQALRNLGAVLAAANLSFADVVTATIYLTDVDDVSVVDEIFGRHMEASRPAHSTVGAAELPVHAKIEIELMAARR